MKIAILTPFLHRPGGHGGITTWLLNVSNEFQGRGHQVDVLVSADRGAALEHRRLNPSINLVSLGKGKLSLYGNLYSYLRQHRPDIILSAGYRYNTAIALTLPIARVRTRWVMTIRENLSKAVSTLSATRRIPRSFALRLCLRTADKTVGVSSSLADDMIAHWGLRPERAASIHNAVVDDRIVELGLQEVDHPFFGSGDKVLVAVGRLEAQKDYPTLFEAMSDLLRTHPARLIVLGEGQQRDALQTQIESLGLESYISLVGFTDNPFAYMRKADGVVMSSIWEGFGNVLAEAMAQGTPVVSTDCPSGPAEILDNGKYGPLVPVGDAPALADGIRRILDQPCPEATLKNRARAFSVSARVDDYLRLFEQLLVAR